MKALIVLSPREHGLLERASTTGANAEIVQMLQYRVKREIGIVTIELTPAEIADVRKASKNWKGGAEIALGAIVQAIDRSPEA